LELIKLEKVLPIISIVDLVAITSYPITEFEIEAPTKLISDPADTLKMSLKMNE